MAMDLPRLDETLPEPLYEQLAQAIREAIRTGRLAGGTAMPSLRQFAQRLGLGLITVQTAYQRLAEEGYLQARPRRGYFVARLLESPAQALPADPAPPGAGPDEPAARATVVPRPAWLYDFTYEGVDPASFPCKDWSRLTRQLLAARPAFLSQPPPPGGLPQLTQALAAYLAQARGVRCQPEQIIISSGSDALLSLLLRLLPPEACRCFGVENPGYNPVAEQVAAQGLPLLPLPVRREAGGIDYRALLESPVTCLSITPTHQFPTGAIMPVTLRYKLLDWLARQPARYILEDDYDSELKYVGRAIPALKSLPGSERVVYLGSFGKCISPGLRLSYMVLPQSLQQRLPQLKPGLRCPVPVLEQAVMAAFLTSPAFDRQLAENRKRYRAKRNFMVQAVRAWGRGRCRITGAEAGLHLLLEIDSRWTAPQLCRKAARQGIRVYPLEQFCRESALPLPQSRPCLLLGYAQISETSLKEGLRRLLSLILASPAGPAAD